MENLISLIEQNKIFGWSRNDGVGGGRNGLVAFVVMAMVLWPFAQHSFSLGTANPRVCLIHFYLHCCARVSRTL